MEPPRPAPCCAAAPCADPARRKHLKRAAVLLAGLGACRAPNLLAAEEEESTRPQAGDLLVRADAAGNPAPLGPGDIAAGAKPIHAFPLDPASGTVRDGSRLNKVLLLRLASDRLDETTRERAADGVVAYSAVCTHQGCDISEWVEKVNALLCFCHFSQFLPGEGGAVLAGPAPRNLPQLPLRVDGDRLVIAGPFSAKPGVKHKT